MNYLLDNEFMGIFSKIKEGYTCLFSSKEKDAEPIPSHPLQTFLSLTVDEVMVPRSDIVGLASQMTFEEVLKKFLKTGFRWMPVFRETLDDIAGIVSVHCILSLKEHDEGEREWRRHLNQAFFTPSSMTVEEALRYFYYHHKTEIIFVVDEHGGVQGMLTKGHLLKEACEWCLEGFSEEEMIISRDPLVIDGRMDLESFKEELGGEMLFDQEDEERVNTIGGWICAYLERVPLTGEVISHPSGFSFEIRQATPRTIHQIAVLSSPDSPESSEAA